MPVLPGVDPEDFTALHSCAARNNVDMAEALLRNGTMVNMQTFHQGLTPLHLAVTFGHLEMASTLLSYGADKNILSKEGKQPLEIAQDNGHTLLVQLLADQENHSAIGNQVIQVQGPPGGDLTQAFLEASQSDIMPHHRTPPPPQRRLSVPNMFRSRSTSPIMNSARQGRHLRYSPTAPRRRSSRSPRSPRRHMRTPSDVQVVLPREDTTNYSDAPPSYEEVMANPTLYPKGEDNEIF